MARLRLRAEKQADDGSRVRLLENSADHSWLVGRDGDPALDPFPLGSFQSAEAARRWADQRFAGGRWVPTRS